MNSTRSGLKGHPANGLHPVALAHEDLERLHHLRQHRRAARGAEKSAHTTGQRVADGVAALVGSWRFIIVQSALLALWIGANALGWVKAWDPYPFILLTSPYPSRRPTRHRSS